MPFRPSFPGRRSAPGPGPPGRGHSTTCVPIAPRHAASPHGDPELRIRRWKLMADTQETREAGQSLAGEATVAVGDPAADGRRIGALRVAEAAADAEAAPVRGTHLQRTQAPLKAALAGQVCDDLGLGVCVRLVLEQCV